MKLNPKVLNLLVKIGIAILTTIGGYLGASANVNHWF